MRGDIEEAEAHEDEARSLLDEASLPRLGQADVIQVAYYSAVLAKAQAHATLALSLRQADHTKALRAVTHRGAILTHQRGT